MLHTGAAPPYGRMLPSIVPCNSAVNFPALRAIYDARQGVLAAVNPFLSFLPAVEVRPPRHFLLYPHVNLTGNDRLMAVLHIILGNDAVVLHSFLGEEIHGIGLLQEGVPDVFLIAQNLLNRGRQPLFFPCACEDTVRLQPVTNLCQTCALQVFPVDSFCL